MELPETLAELEALIAAHFRSSAALRKYHATEAEAHRQTAEQFRTALTAYQNEDYDLGFERMVDAAKIAPQF